jgi:hypothetical protein
LKNFSIFTGDFCEKKLRKTRVSCFNKYTDLALPGVIGLDMPDVVLGHPVDGFL